MERSPNVARLRPSATIAVSSLAKRLASEGRDIINLSAGEPDFDTPSFISEAAIQGIRQGQTRYTPAPGMPELRKAVAATLSERAGRPVPWEGIVVSTGAKQALFNACFSIFGPGDEVLVGTPYWTSYPEIVGLCRAEAVPVAGQESRDFKLTPEDLERAATPRTRGFLYSSPGNPTGVVYSRDELQALAEWCRDRGVWLLADEIYREIYFGAGGQAPGLLELPPECLGNHVLFDGASKSFAMTGWRMGFSLSTPEWAKVFTALQSHTTSNVATPSQVAALAAYSRTDETAAAVAEMREAFRRRRDLVERLFREKLPQLPYLEPGGAFYLFFRVDGVFGPGRQTAAELCSWLLEEAGVALVPGEAFGDPRFARLSYATSDELLVKAVDRIAEALAG
ncbi:MAG: pyridoxal phosphate-dependent aminotransferase [Gemmatimonadales bacterium]|jgi:aspartate aminotransferase|nr:MAG: pyridoxal phosphate-dependent aminotransferase [Gemmatimonadales bacterium]